MHENVMLVPKNYWLESNSCILGGVYYLGVIRRKFDDGGLLISIEEMPQVNFVCTSR